jgi:hypothetical protein
MIISRAIARLAMLAPLVIGAGCSSSGSSTCTYCDAGKPDRPDEPVAVADAPAGEEAPSPDAESEVMAGDGPVAIDEEVPIDERQSYTADGSAMDATDAPAVEAAEPTPIPDAGILFSDDFEQGGTAGWQTMDWNDAGAPDTDWSVFIGDIGAVYSEVSLDKKEWHVAYAASGAVADQIVEAKMRVVEFYDTTPSYVAALFARYDPSSDSGYFVALRGDGSVIIRKRVQGKNASWAAGVDAGIAPGVWHVVRLEVLGDTANAFLDGSLIYSVVDSDPLAAGTAGLGTFGATIEVDRIFLAQP